MTINKAFDVPEIKNSFGLKQKIIALLLVVLLVFILIYVNVSSGSNKSEVQELDDKAVVLNFNENSMPRLVDDRKSNDQPTFANKQLVGNNLDESQKTNVDFSNVDPVKLMQFKKIMDAENDEHQKEIIQRRKTATLIMNSERTQNLAQNGVSLNSEKNKTAALDNGLNKGTELVQAERTSSLNSSILEGTVIHATLETAVNSDLPGSMRAVINRAVYSADGMNKLLNPGDRLVMQYTSKLTQGANRIFAFASRIIKSDGVSINLGSQVASPLGISGVGSDSVDTHFFARFAEASLMAIISASAATFNVSDKEELNSKSLYREGLSSSFSNAANESLQANAGRAPTLYVNQGKEISIFVAKDISFSDIYGDKL